jgi:hypothetical protein
MWCLSGIPTLDPRLNYLFTNTIRVVLLNGLNFIYLWLHINTCQHFSNADKACFPRFTTRHTQYKYRLSQLVQVICTIIYSYSLSHKFCNEYKISQFYTELCLRHIHLLWDTEHIFSSRLYHFTVFFLGTQR